MAIVTTQELANYLGGWKYTSVQELDAQAILDGVQSELERYINRPLQMRRVVEAAQGTALGFVHLAVTPIVAVHGIYRANTDGAQGELITSLPRDFFQRGSNFLKVGICGRVYVDYTGGVNGDIDPGVKLAIKRVAAREFMYKHNDGVALDNTEGRKSEDPVPQPKGWTDEELKRFDRMRRRTIA